VKPVRVGLVGAGPWAEMVHAPLLTGGPETELAGVWARRHESALELAQPYGAVAYSSLEELLDDVDAVAFAVPPAVQAELALQAAAAGKPVLLEKPLGDDVAGAEALVKALDVAGVLSVVTLSYRFAPAVRRFLKEASSFEVRGGRAHFITGALLGGAFATPWRIEKGALLDIGPHAIDLLEAAVGPVAAVKATHGSRDWTAVTLEHEGGQVTQVSLCSHAGVDPLQIGLDLFGTQGVRSLDVTKAMGPIFGEAIASGSKPLGAAEAFSTLRAEFAQVVRSGEPHELDATYALRLQRILAEAEHQLTVPPGRVE